MELSFDKIPSEIVLFLERPTTSSVAEEIQKCQELLSLRTTKCKPIKPIYKTYRKKPLKYTYKFFCVCPRYNPAYCCKHTGNVIIDRDVLTKEEHICFLATPKENFAAPRGQPHYIHKKAVMPDCTARIERLAVPKLKRVKGNLEEYAHILQKRQFESLSHHLDERPEMQFTSITMALSYIEEERRLRRVAKNVEKRHCKKIKRDIKHKQRRQIKKIICVLFEEMKDFLLNDQFLVDEHSTLCTVILDKIREFTDKEFYTTSNLREYQHILANNLTVWINKFIANLNIQVAPSQPKAERPEPESFLPVKDYMSVSESMGEEEYASDNDDYAIYKEGNYDEDEVEVERISSEMTIKNTNP